MTEDTTMPAAAPAESTTTLGEIISTSAAETPADTEETMPAEAPAEEYDNGEEQPERPKKLSGAQRAKRREEYLLNELQERDRRLEELQAQRGDDRSEDDRKRNHDAHMGRLKDAREVIADFDASMSKMAGVFIHDDVLDEIVSSDKSPLLAYHLAKNPDKLRELNSMKPRELAREIGRLESSLRMPVGKKQTAAPPPITTLKGGAAPHTALEQVDDMNVFAERLMKDLAKRSGR